MTHMTPIPTWCRLDDCAFFFLFVDLLKWLPPLPAVARARHTATGLPFWTRLLMVYGRHSFHVGASTMPSLRAKSAYVASAAFGSAIPRRKL